MTKFAERLKELRIEKGLSQRALAKELKINQPCIARWESKLQVPNIDVAVMFAKYFGVTTDYLLGLEDYLHILIVYVKLLKLKRN